MVRPRSHTAASAPKVPKGSAISTDSGSDHFSYCAARIRNTITTARPSARPEVPAERFSWNDAPPQSKLNSGGSVSRAICSTRAIAWPELTPGARLPEDLHRRQVVEAVERVRRPTVKRTVASDDSGTISPLAERTHMLPMSSGRLRYCGSAYISTCQVRPYLLKSLT